MAGTLLGTQLRRIRMYAPCPGTLLSYFCKAIFLGEMAGDPR